MFLRRFLIVSLVGFSIGSALLFSMEKGRELTVQASDIFEKSQSVLTTIQNLKPANLIEDDLLGAPGTSARVLDMIDRVLGEFVAAMSNMEVFSSSIHTNSVSQRLAALSWVISINISHSENFVKANTHFLIDLLLNTYAKLIEIHNIQNSQNFLLSQFETFKTEQCFVAANLRLIATVIAKMIKDDEKKSKEDLVTLAKLYVFITITEQAPLRKIFTTNVRFNGENFVDFCSPFINKIIESRVNYEIAQLGPRSTKDEFQRFFDFVEEFLYVAVSSLPDAHESRDELAQGEDDKPLQAGLTREPLRVVSLAKKDLSLIIFKLGFLFFVYQDAFLSVRNAIESSLFDEPFVEKSKLFLGKLVNFVLDIQNAIEKKAATKSMLRAHLNSVILIPLSRNYFFADANGEEVLEGGDVATGAESFLKNTHNILKHLVKKNILELQRHEKNKMQLKWLLIASLATISIAVGMAFTSVFPPLALATLGGTSAVLSSITGGKTWDHVKDLITRQPEASQIDDLRVVLMRETSGYIHVLGKVDVDFADSFKQSIVTFLTKKWFGASMKQQQVEEQLTGIAMAAGQQKEKGEGNVSKINVLLREILNKMRVFDERITRLEQKMGL